MGRCFIIDGAFHFDFVRSGQMTFRFNFEKTLQAAGVLLSLDGEVQKLNAKGNVCRQATGSLAPESKRSLMKRSLSRRPWWRRARLSIRGLMVLVLVIGAGLGWFIRRAAVQRDAAKAIVAAGGSVRYDFAERRVPLGRGALALDRSGWWVSSASTSSRT